jgi:hypothetical protein
MNTMELPQKSDKPERKKPGPVPGLRTRKVNLLLEVDLAEWGKHQPGGLSELMRRLLKEEYQRQQQAGK